MFKVVYVSPPPGKDLGEKTLEPLGAEFSRGAGQSASDIIASTKNADAVLGRIAGLPFTRQVIETLGNCRIIAGTGVGYEGVDLEAATEKGIAVTNVPDYCIDEVSGRAIAMILNLGYKIDQVSALVKEKQANMLGNVGNIMQTVLPTFRLRDQTLGIIGMSRLGTATALKAKGLGMRVIASDPYVSGGVMESMGVKPVDFDTLLKESDFISLHIPLTKETTNLIGYEQFKKMKPTCYFINTARGGCVDELAMIKALQERLIAGAGLDVTVKEPIEKDNPLCTMSNVILTGHTAWYSNAAEAELFPKPMTQVVLALKGKWPLYVVNPDVRRKWLERWKV
jgi:D-3-phosphoglycerate dehydrogenase